MLKIVICDDLVEDLKSIRKVVDKLSDFNIKVYEYTNPVDCLKDIENGERFDIFLLDILIEKYNGIDLAKEIRATHPETPILFITATTEFALNGYEVNAMRYYLKPVDENKLYEDMNKFLKVAHKKNSEFITISSINGLIKIMTKDIYYIESMLRSVIVHTQDESYQAIGKISQYEDDLKNSSFIRVHKSFLVNLKYIKKIYKNIIELDNNESVFLSKHRSKKVHEELLKYIGESL